MMTYIIMKNLKHPTRLIFTLCFLAFSRLGFSQTCPASFTFTYGLNGAVVFSAVGSTSISATTTHSWNFGDGASASLIGAAGVNTSHTYTLNGTYTVSLLNMNPAVSCTSTALTQTIQITNAVCFLNITYSAPGNANLCTGTATVNAVNMCGAPSFTWNNGSNSNTISGLCPGNSYSLTATSSGVNCCTVAVASVFIPTCNVTTQFVSTPSCCAAGSMSFTSNSSGIGPGAIYSWDFGDNTAPATSTASSSGHTYTVITTFQAKLKVTSTVGCKDSITNPVVVPCNLNASFISSNGVGGLVNFTSNSSSVLGNASYTWIFGANSNSISGIGLTQVANTFSTNGIYTVTLIVSNGGMPVCTSSVTQTVNIIIGIPCNLQASFIYSTNQQGVTGFTNTSTGTIPTSSYLWNFAANGTASGTAAAVTYSNSGNYSVILTVVNSSVCASTSTQVIFVNLSVPCNVTASFVHIVGANGAVNFTNTSLGTNSTTTYFWDFGDGIYSTGLSPSHSFAFAGAYNVSLYVNNQLCGDSVIFSVNVTGVPCVANAGFSLSPTTTPQYWIAIPNYPWNVTNATWFWGDGTSANGLYTSHAYAVADNYNICLTVTVSCGAKDSVCSSYNVFKTLEIKDEKNIIYINVRKPGLVTSLDKEELSDFNLTLYPNPNNGQFNLKINNAGSDQVTITIYNLMSEIVYARELIMSGDKTEELVELNEVSNGVYILRVDAGGKTIIKKIILDK